MLRPLWRHAGCCVCLQPKPNPIEQSPHQAWASQQLWGRAILFYLHTEHPLCPPGGSTNPQAFGLHNCAEPLPGRGLVGPRPPVAEGWAAGVAQERGFPLHLLGLVGITASLPASPGTGDATLVSPRPHSSMHSAVSPPWRLGSRTSLVGPGNYEGGPECALQYVGEFLCLPGKEVNLGVTSSDCLGS